MQLEHDLVSISTPATATAAFDIVPAKSGGNILVLGMLLVFTCAHLVFIQQRQQTLHPSEGTKYN